jgi:phosphopantothenate-cysteine ligase
MEIKPILHFYFSRLLKRPQVLSGKKALITSGGTIAPIDDVRHIGNFSSGEFPACLAEACLLKRAEVFYVHGKGSKIPFQKNLNLDPGQSFLKEMVRLWLLRSLYRKFEDRRLLHLVGIKTVPEYATALEDILRGNAIDIVFLGAAVSDFSPKKVEGKIKSQVDTLSLSLTKNPKIIDRVKKWTKQPIFQVGFKLLSGVSDEELINVAYSLLLSSRSDLVLANDLRQIRTGRRIVYIVTPEKGAVRIDPSPRQADEIVEFVARRADTTHFKTKIVGDFDILQDQRELFQSMKKYCHIFYRIGFMTPYLPQDSRSHGSIALRIPGTDQFLITARNSNKNDLAYDDVVKVEEVDFNTHTILISSANKRRASLNAPLIAEIFGKFPKINVVLHTHNRLIGIPTTDFPHTPGTVEYVNAAMQVLDENNPLILLKEHGLLAIGKNLSEAVQVILSASLKTDLIGKNQAYQEFPDKYDLIYKRYAEHLDDFIELGIQGLTPGAKVLDAAAGTGSVSLELMKKGFEVTAADIHPQMLSVLKKKGEELGLSPARIIPKGFLDFGFEEEFDAVVIRQAINYLIGRENLVGGLKRFKNALKPGGKLIFNAPNYNPSQTNYPEKLFEVEEGDLRGLVLEWNSLKGSILTHHHDCAIWDETSAEKAELLHDVNTFQLYTADEFRQALMEAGFSSVQFFSTNLQTYNPQDKTLYMEAIK